jgi:dihydroneopterin aldolase / 2-amino-4-hydroxy-6-hydroxymethyldihydropteridine diphosphokinase / dihydropteroate synthase
MYVTEQPAFLNAMVEIRTELKPSALLRSLQSIETDLGRLRNTQRFGPRTIDLDIVLYGKTVVDLPNDELTIPHPRLHEREFVLQPLCDIDDTVVVPGSSNGHAGGAELTVRQLLDRRKGSKAGAPAGPDCGMTRVSPLRHSTRSLLEWDGTPKMMGIVNATPDSFSDGGSFQTLDKALALAQEYVRHGFDIIDVRRLQSAVAYRVR